MTRPLIYCCRALIQNLHLDDREQLHPYFGSAAWKNINDNIRSRVHDINSPITFAPPTSAMPRDLDGAETDFARVFDHVADAYVRQTVANGQRAYLFFSGGIDSTSILVALLRTGNRQFLDNLQIVCNASSMSENPYFFDRFIKDKFPIIPADSWQIDPATLEQSVFFDGEGGNQIMGSYLIYDLVRAAEHDRLAEPWTVLPPEFTQAHSYWQDQCRESMKHSPVPIVTVHDLLWWLAFNFHWEYALLRQILVCTKHFSVEQRRKFYDHHLVRFYAHPEVQRWSMATCNLRRESLKITPKFYPKRYIHEWDHNDIYFQQKREMPSASAKTVERLISSQWIFGVDADFNLIDMKDQHTRKTVIRPLIFGS